MAWLMPAIVEMVIERICTAEAQIARCMMQSLAAKRWGHAN